MVLIDMEMPKNCGDCQVVASQTCLLTGRNLITTYFDLFRPSWCPLKPFTQQEPKITTNIYDTEEIHHNCTVQILTNSVTGDVSVGWWKEKEEE